MASSRMGINVSWIDCLSLLTFNGEQRAEYLNVRWFLNLADSREIWGIDVNTTTRIVLTAQIGYNFLIEMHNSGGATSRHRDHSRKISIRGGPNFGLRTMFIRYPDAVADRGNACVSDEAAQRYEGLASR